MSSRLLLEVVAEAKAGYSRNCLRPKFRRKKELMPIGETAEGKRNGVVRLVRILRWLNRE